RTAAPAPEPALRGGARGRAALHRAAHPYARIKKPAPAGTDRRGVHRRLWRCPHPDRVRARTGRAARLSPRPVDDGHASLAADGLGRGCRDRRGAQAAAGVSETPLKKKLRLLIEANGPITIADY